MGKDPYSKRAGDFHTVIQVVHKATGTLFRTNGNRVEVKGEEGFLDEINTCDYERGGNKVRSEAQLRSVAANWLNEQVRGER
jgi:hypothetical protein